MKHSTTTEKAQTSDISVPSEKALYDYRSAGAFLGGLSRSMLKTLVGRGELHPIKIGRRTFFRITDLTAFVARHEAAA